MRMIKAEDAVEGGLYNIPPRGQYEGDKQAVFNGWNHSHQWLLFVVYGERGSHKIKLVMPDQLIEEI